MVEPCRPDLLAEPINRLIASPRLRKVMGHAGRRRAEAEFDVKVASGRYIEALEAARAYRAQRELARTRQ